MPRTVIALCHTSHGWLVGSAADPSCDSPNDFDIVVPYSHWHIAAPQIPADAKPNKLGGWRFSVEGVEIDVWPDDMGRLLATGNIKHAYCPLSNVRIETR